MGAGPSAPKDEQMEELKETTDESVQRAAAAIAQADVLLLLTGAGWSADSGLSVYKDVADVQAYRERDLTYSKICEPHWLEDDPELFFGFWGRCFNDYRETREHEGYHIVKCWRDALFDRTKTSRTLAARHGGAAQAFYSFTSNVDAHHLRVFGEAEVRECHGNSETWQCSDRACHTFAESADAPSRWAAPSEFRFAVDGETHNAPDGAPSQPAAAPAGKPQHGFVGNHPKCPRCAKCMRPSILMFADSDWCDDQAQRDRWDAWQSAVEEQAVAQKGGTAPLRVAILEVGAGGNVTTIR
jgi:NAD-dependent SIR2 family protein deacetylase